MPEQEPLDELFPACAAAGVQVIVGGPYNSGILANAGKGGRYNYGAMPADIVARVKRMVAIAAARSIPPAAAALQSPLAHPVVGGRHRGLSEAAKVRQTLE